MCERDALLDLIKCAIEFSNLAAGEGISIDGLSPEDFFFNYSCVTGREDWDTIAEYVFAQIERDGREIERLRAENKRLRRALGRIKDAAFYDNGDVTLDPYAMRKSLMIARAALNGEGET